MAHSAEAYMLLTVKGVHSIVQIAPGDASTRVYVAFVQRRIYAMYVLLPRICAMLAASAGFGSL